MKPTLEPGVMPDQVVAPCAGAWIETLLARSIKGQGRVAPCAGAWIETSLGGASETVICVAPCAGAWIETGSV
mgnify:CR=1 FL=1